MRLTIAKKIATVFASLAIIILLIAGGLYGTLRSFVHLKSDLETVREFQQQAESLEYLEREFILRQQNPTDEKLHNTFLLVQGLADKSDRILKKHKLVDQVGTWDVKVLLQEYKQANLELFHLYREKSAFLERDRLIWDLLLQRTKNLPTEVRSHLNSFFTEILLLQFHVISQGQDDGNIAQIRKLAQKFMGEINEPNILAGIKGGIRNSEENFQLQQAIVAKEASLAKISANFEGLIRQVVTSVSGKIVNQRSQVGGILLLLLLMLVGFVLLAWRFTFQYTSEFLARMKFAISSIRQEDFDFTLPSVRDDEFGDQLIFVKEMADSFKEKISQLSASEQRFRSLVENISDWIWLVDSDDICVYSSPQGVVIHGGQNPDMIGNSIIDIIGGSLSPAVENPFCLKISEKLPFDSFVHKIVNDQGGETELETSGRPIFDNNGQYQGYRFISRDISAARKAEQILKQNALAQQFHNKILGLSLLDLDLDEIFGQFLEVVLAPSWLGLEPAGVVFLVNETGQALEMQAQKGLNLNVSISCGIVPFGVCLCGRAAQMGKVIFCNTIDERHELTFEGMHLHGHYCVPIHSVAGEVIGVFTVYIKEGTARDSMVESALNDAATVLGGIIKRRQAEEKLHKLNIGLEEEISKRTVQLTNANKELDTFAYSVSHDLRAPLRAIDGFSLALLEDHSEVLDEEGRGYLQRVRKGCRTMAQLIEDILQLSRLTRGEINLKTVDISKMAVEVFEILGQGDKGRKVEWSVAPNLQVEADPVMMRAVLDNLLGNSWKYTSTVEEARIELTGQEIDGGMVYCVRDNGVGFDMTYKEKLFAAFQRLHTAVEFEGSGVGLATVQRIIHRHGGKIWAEGEEGQGAEFCFSL